MSVVSTTGGTGDLQMSVVSTTEVLGIANVSGEHHSGYWELQMSVSGEHRRGYRGMQDSVCGIHYSGCCGL